MNKYDVQIFFIGGDTAKRTLESEGSFGDAVNELLNSTLVLADNKMAYPVSQVRLVINMDEAQS